MDYPEGIRHMQTLAAGLKASGQVSASFTWGNLVISYPGYKNHGDYRLSENGIAPKHTDIVDLLYAFTNSSNYLQVISFLEDVYRHGLKSTDTLFTPAVKEKIYWITLQEEINYPPPQYAGRRLPFQRYFEAVLAKLDKCELSAVYQRTNNHGGKRPALFKVDGVSCPSFYQ